jgi:GNAT superfamily N-acetyltransferase
LQREQVLKRATPVPGVTVKSLTESDIPAYLGMEVPYTEEMVATRLRAGDSCIAAWLAGRIVGVRWVTTAGADIGPLEISFSVWPGIAYAYDAFTAPEERGRGIGAMLTAALFESASSAGAIHVINAVLPSSSGQALARGRSQMLGTVSAKNIGPWLIVRCQLPCGYLGAPLPMGARVPNRVSSSNPIVGS